MMRLKISHTTSYDYDEPVPYALQQLRLRPKSRDAQSVIDWNVEIDGGHEEVRFEDEHANIVQLISFTPGVQRIEIRSWGEVEVTDTAGIVGKHTGFVPLWLFRRHTPLTEAGPGVAAMLAGFDKQPGELDTLHALSAHILETLPYSTEQTSSELSAEQALEAGFGVCQDHAHVFIAATRALGYPARYVSGYLLMDSGSDQDASHAWAEVFVQGIGWVGFDISNGISPDARYVRAATGLDYTGASPISGMRFGRGDENLSVKLHIEHQQ